MKGPMKRLLAIPILLIAFGLPISASAAEEFTTFEGFTASNQPPAGYQPYKAATVFNIATTTAKPISNSQEMVNYSLTLGTPSPGNNTEQPADKHPVFYASTTDPQYKIKLEEPWGENSIQGVTIRIPKYATGAEGGTDHHMSVIEQDGTEYDFWKVLEKVDGSPGTLRASWGGKGSYTGDANGVSPTSGATAAGFMLGAGLIRYPEIAAATATSYETISHGIFLVIKNARKGHIAPAVHDDGAGPEEAKVPYEGQRFALMNTAGTAAMSKSEIESVTSKPWQRAVLSAFARYGGIDGDKGNSGFYWATESATMYTAAGLANPWKTYGEEHSLPLFEGHYVYKLIEGSLTLTWWKEHLKAITVTE
jgi:hypothetical protein